MEEKEDDKMIDEGFNAEEMAALRAQYGDDIPGVDDEFE